VDRTEARALRAVVGWGGEPALFHPRIPARGRFPTAFAVRQKRNRKSSLSHVRWNESGCGAASGFAAAAGRAYHDAGHRAQDPRAWWPCGSGSVR